MERRLQEFLRKNSYDEASSTLVIHSQRYDAFRELYGHYAGLFMNDPALDELRADYAIARNSIRSEDRMEKMGSSFSGPPGPASPTSRFRCHLYP